MGTKKTKIQELTTKPDTKKPRKTAKIAKKSGKIKYKTQETEEKKKKPKTKKMAFDAKLLKEIDGNFTDGIKEKTTITKKDKETGEQITEEKELVRYSKSWWLFKYKECQTAKQKLNFVDKFTKWINDCKKDLSKMQEFKKLAEAIKNL